MKKSSITKVLCGVPLFSDLQAHQAENLIEQSRVCTYPSGSEILSDREITVILKGGATVTKQMGEKKLLMRILGTGAVSGVASLFGNEQEALSSLTAAKSTEVMLIPHEAVKALISESPEFALKYISFLTSRIRFLNERIRAYTVGDTEARLALHLLLSDENESGQVELPVSLTALADMLDMGRASLYRALDSLTKKGIISRQGKKIIILSRDALKCV